MTLVIAQADRKGVHDFVQIRRLTMGAIDVIESADVSLIKVDHDEFDGKVRVVITKSREGRWAQQIVADHPNSSDGSDRRSSADLGESFERV